MRLTRYSDYAVRVLIYLASSDGRLSSIGEIARTYDISQNHLMKVVHDLGKGGFLTTIRGRNGGIRLARKPREINLGEVIRFTEQEFQLAECDACLIECACGLSSILDEAVAAFMRVLDGYTLVDAMQGRHSLMPLFVNGDCLTCSESMPGLAAMDQ